MDVNDDIMSVGTDTALVVLSTTVSPSMFSDRCRPDLWVRAIAYIGVFRMNWGITEREGGICGMMCESLKCERVTWYFADVFAVFYSQHTMCLVYHQLAWGYGRVRQNI